MKTLIGPFDQIITMRRISDEGPVREDQLEIIKDGGVLIEGHLIHETGNFDALIRKKPDHIEEIRDSYVLLPGFIDSHTHICFAGSRARDYTSRISGATYQEILRSGGGIYDTVKHTRNTNFRELYDLTEKRISHHFGEGITTLEIKSGYGLSTESELKMLNVIQRLNEVVEPDLVATCLAAHTISPDFSSSTTYLENILKELLPQIRKEKLADRVDIFIEENAFTPEEGFQYLSMAKKMNFRLTVHADQFTSGGSEIAARLNAVSADHLEMISDRNIRMLIENGIVATVLPGASLGLGLPFAPARKILDAGGCLVIASDWNPGSAPMGDLLTQAALLSAYQKLSFAETMAGITFRAAKALSLSDRGTLDQGKLADFIAFNTPDYREILYHQGRLKPHHIWKNGKKQSKYSGS
jgi:imidazolonepropionase